MSRLKFCPQKKKTNWGFPCEYTRKHPSDVEGHASPPELTPMHWHLAMDGTGSGTAVEVDGTPTRRQIAAIHY